MSDFPGFDTAVEFRVDTAEDNTMLPGLWFDRSGEWENGKPVFKARENPYRLKFLDGNWAFNHLGINMYVRRRGKWIYKDESKKIKITVTHRCCIENSDCLIQTSNYHNCYFLLLVDNLYKSSPTDLTFALRDGGEIPAHRSVIYAMCPAWAALLDSDMKDSVEGVIRLDDIDPVVARSFVKTLYYGIVEDRRLLPVTAELADRYRAESLLRKLIPAITDALDEEGDEFYKEVIELIKKLSGTVEKNVLKDKLFDLNIGVPKESYFQRLGI